MWRPFVLSISVVLAACQAPAAVGASCARSSDCSAPLACTLGRCRVACRESRDCAPGSRCVASPPVAACTLDVENHCDGTVCPAPLTCVADRCRSGCTSDGDCVSGHCTGGTCDEPVSGDDAGVLVDASQPSDGGGDASASDAGTDAGCVASACAYGRCTAAGVCDDVVDLSLGDAHFCVVRAGGTVVCAGAGGAGQLGNGMTPASSTPVTALFVATAERVAADRWCTCAILHDQSVQCWGSAMCDGNGHATATSEPAMVTGLSGVTALGGSDLTYCALDGSGTVSCWGADLTGQCGDGMMRNFWERPVAPVPAITGARSVATGVDFGCAATSTGSVSCWGGCFYGQCGDTTNTMVRWAPVDVVGLTGPVAELAAGGEHVCVRYETGGVACWGEGTSGQLGYGAASNQNQARPVMGLSDAMQICAGVTHTCALRATGDVVCWGLGDHGAIGDGMTMQRDVPTPAMIHGVRRITCGRQATCALRSDGSVWCWGQNANDLMMLGGTPGTDVPMPTQIPALP